MDNYSAWEMLIPYWGSDLKSKNIQIGWNRHCLSIIILYYQLAIIKIRIAIIQTIYFTYHYLSHCQMRWTKIECIQQIVPLSMTQSITL